jgi:phage head maturation protease
MKRGIKRGLSIGFQTVQDAVVDGVRLLREVKLWEISIVTFPALQSARVVSAKAELGLEQIRQIVHDEVRSLAEKQAEPKIDGPSEPHPEIATALQGAATFFKGVDNA